MDFYEQQAELTRALAHPVRLRILDILAQQESCVCHLTAILKQRQPYVSQHLMILREAGLVVDRKEGLIVYYRLADPGIVETLSALREALRRRGMDVSAPAIPPSPVEGCPCPRCHDDVAVCGEYIGSDCQTR